MARVAPLFSGSSGNCTYIGTENGGFLVDAGASFKAICTALEKQDTSIESIKAIAVTHEHSDHIKGLKTLLKNTKIPLIASNETLKSLIAGGYIPENIKTLSANDRQIDINDILIERFATSHDCEGSSGFTFLLPDDKKVSVCTDLGVMTDSVRSAITKSDVVLIESNHDVQMLKNGPYPPMLKLRIMSEQGHLSNIACAEELPRLLQSGTTRIILGHLSRNNNTPILAKSAAVAALMNVGAKENRDYYLLVAKQENNEGIAL